MPLQQTDCKYWQNVREIAALGSLLRWSPLIRLYESWLVLKSQMVSGFLFEFPFRAGRLVVAFETRVNQYILTV